jgi:hypothetical protein
VQLNTLPIYFTSGIYIQNKPPARLAAGTGSVLPVPPAGRVVRADDDQESLTGSATMMARP